QPDVAAGPAAGASCPAVDEQLAFRPGAADGAGPVEPHPAVVGQLAFQPDVVAGPAAVASSPAVVGQLAFQPGAGGGAGPGESHPAVPLAAWLACAVRLAEQPELVVAAVGQPQPADARAASALARY